MKMRSYTRKINHTLLTLAFACLALCGCDGGGIYDYEGDCNAYYKVRFRYDYNMKYANAFAHEVNSITLYLIDHSGKVVWQRTEQGEALADENYAMDVEVEPGNYHLLAWGGTVDKGSFEIPETTVGTDLTCTLNRRRSADGSAFVDQDIDRLFHGWLASQEFVSTEGVYTYTVPLVKNTNNIRLVLQHISGEPVNKDKFLFTITDSNGRMDWDNSLLPDDEITYYAWHVEDVEAEIEPRSSRATTAYGAAIAEFTIPRMVVGQEPRLTVTNIVSGETVFSIPLIDYATLVKGYYNREMSDQEYLDRQDEFNMVFFLDEGDRWFDAYIYINSWKVVLQNTDL